MAKGDVRIIDSGGHNVVPTYEVRTEAAATDIKAGEPVKRGGTGGNFAIPLATGDPEISADLVLGIAASDSDHTAAANGVVQVYMPLPGVIYGCAATTAANFDTDAEILLLELDRVAFDLTSTTYTVDENEGDNADHGLIIVGGDADTQEVHFMISSATTLLGNNDI